MSDFDEELFKRRMLELSERAYNRGIYTYTSFLSLSEQDIIYRLKRTLVSSYEFFGGFPSAERKIARFGEANYEEVYPIVVIKAEPKAQKFSDELSHRDFLGALMSLGIKRELIGDIVVEENRGYILCLDKSAEFICQNLVKIKHTDITCSICEALPNVGEEKLEEMTVIIQSERIDSIIAAAFSLSRSAAQDLIERGLCFANSKLIEKLTYLPETGEIISVRGKGRFVYESVAKNTKKGRLCVVIKKYI